MADRVLFISYQSADRKLAKELCQLIVHSGIAKADEIFFAEQGSIRNGEPFTEAIFAALRSARVVLALLTPRALRSSSVLAEMASARAMDPDLSQRKLRLMAVPAAQARKTMWPIEKLQACRAEQESEVRKLIEELAVDFGRAAPASDLGAEIARFTRMADSLRYRDLPTVARLAPWILGGAAILAAAYFVGRLQEEALRRIDRYEVTERVPLQAGRSVVTLVSPGTFPRLKLAERLHELRGAKTLTADEAQRAFKAALKVAQDEFGPLKPHELLALSEVVDLWQGEPPAETSDDGNRRLKCGDEGRLEVDNRWCKKVKDIFPDDRSSNRFDDATFAVLRVVGAGGADVVAVAKGTAVQVDGRTFEVTGISTGLRPAVHLKTVPIKP
ncbi:MAG: toll/interleukin-1 receptor domain-containing protein [Rhodoferax sp.]|nr:toll/interleukin-1 receptor domain-containing protein [Rhodoferax sp.]